MVVGGTSTITNITANAKNPMKAIRRTPKQILILFTTLGLVSLWLNLRGLNSISSTPESSSSFSNYHYEGSDGGGGGGGDIVPSSCQTSSSSQSFAPNKNTKTNETTTTTTNSIIINVTSKPKIFHCGGYALNRNFQPVLKSVLNEYTFVDLREKIASIGNLSTKELKVLDQPSNPWDIFVSNYQLNDCQQPKQKKSGNNNNNNGDGAIVFYQWLQLSFEGKIIFWTPEDATNYRSIISRPNNYFYELGPPIIKTTTKTQKEEEPSNVLNYDNNDRNHFTIRFLQAAFWAQLSHQQKMMILDPTQKPISTKEHFLIYAHSNCVGVRQHAFRKIANFEGLPTVHYGGKCNGGIKNKNTTKATKYPNKVRLANWEDNIKIYQNFRFCLTMEHIQTPGYITEKILVAFWAGCIPIYWGSTEIYDIFNHEAFIFWDVDNYQPALSKIRYLESNRTAYDEVLKEKPIFAPGAVEKYFSFDERYGGGQLQKRLRTFLGLDQFSFGNNIQKSMN